MKRNYFIVAKQTCILLKKKKLHIWKLHAYKTCHADKNVTLPATYFCFIKRSTFGLEKACPNVASFNNN